MGRIIIFYNIPMCYTTLFFDLDDTLYDSRCGLWDAIKDRMNLYMAEQLKIPAGQIGELRHHYYVTYGTTLRGLQHHYNVDPDDFLAYVHDLPLPDYLSPDPVLRRLLLSLPQARWVFTNADAAHARRVIAVLGLDGCFSGIVDVRAAQFACKPDPAAYPLAMQMAGESDPGRCIFFDDSPRNLAPARALGMMTVRVGSTEPDPAAVLSIPSLLDLPRVLPELWPAHVDGL